MAGQGGPTTHPAGLGGDEGGTAQRVKTGWPMAAGLGKCYILIKMASGVI